MGSTVEQSAALTWAAAITRGTESLSREEVHELMATGGEAFAGARVAGADKELAAKIGEHLGAVASGVEGVRVSHGVMALRGVLNPAAIGNGHDSRLATLNSAPEVHHG